MDGAGIYLSSFENDVTIRKVAGQVCTMCIRGREYTFDERTDISFRYINREGKISSLLFEAKTGIGEIAGTLRKIVYDKYKEVLETRKSKDLIPFSTIYHELYTIVGKILFMLVYTRGTEKNRELYIRSQEKFIKFARRELGTESKFVQDLGFDGEVTYLCCNVYLPLLDNLILTK